MTHNVSAIDRSDEDGARSSSDAGSAGCSHEEPAEPKEQTGSGGPSGGTGVSGGSCLLSDPGDQRELCCRGFGRDLRPIELQWGQMTERSPELGSEGCADTGT